MPLSPQSKLATGTQGMISSAHPMATKVGLMILQRGGNAFDAAVAIAAALNVVEPMNSGIGGYGTILLYQARQRKCRFLNSSSRIPMNVESDRFRPPAPNFEANRRGAMAISTPGNVRGWQVLSEVYGNLPWADLLQPAIDLAQNGFAVTWALARDINRYFSSFPSHAQMIYSRNGRPLQTGELLVQDDLAHSLALIAREGPAVFYGGPLGQRIVSVVQASGGVLSLADLTHCKADWFEPLAITYRDHQIFTASPPATSFAALIRLGLMSQFNVKALDHNSAEYLHLFAEVTKHAYRCRLAYAADPDISKVPLEELLSTQYWQEVGSQLNMTQAVPFNVLLPTAESSPHTTHFVVADKEGNIVSATQTIGQMFGSRLMPPGTGIWMNNSLQYCTFEPKGNPMDAHPGRHKLSGDCPVIIFRDGYPIMALGTPGGHTIPQTVPQIIMNLLDFGMDMAEAIAQPRISFKEPDQILADPPLADATRTALAVKGHLIQEFADGLGNAHGLTLEYEQSAHPIRFSGAADPRGEGLAVGL